MLMYYTLDIEDRKEFQKEMKEELKKKSTNEHIFDDTNKVEIINNILSLVNSGLETVGKVISIFNRKNTLASILFKIVSSAMNIK